VRIIRHDNGWARATIHSDDADADPSGAVSPSDGDIVLE
jgi:hypothetical protein